MLRTTDRPNLTVEEHNAILDYVRLRRNGEEIDIIWCECGKYYRHWFDYSEKEELSIKEFVEYVNSKSRKRIQKETQVKKEIRCFDVA